MKEDIPRVRERRLTMFIRENLKAGTCFRLWRRIRELKKKYPELEVLDKGLASCFRTKQSWWYAIVRYDDGTPLPEVLNEDDYETREFESEKDLKEFVNRWPVTNYWPISPEETSNDVWKVICLRRSEIIM